MPEPAFGSTRRPPAALVLAAALHLAGVFIGLALAPSAVVSPPDPASAGVERPRAIAFPLGPLGTAGGLLVALGGLSAGIASLRGSRISVAVPAFWLAAAGVSAGLRAGSEARSGCLARLEDGAPVLAAGVLLDRVPRIPPPSGALPSGAGAGGSGEESGRATVRLGTVRIAAAGRRCGSPRMRATVAREESSFEVGTAVLVRGRWRALGHGSLPRRPEGQGYLAGHEVDVARGAGASVRFVGWRPRWRGELARRLDARLPPRLAPIAKALILADRTTLESLARRQFADAGIIHLLAISGLHVGLLAGGLVWIAGWWRRGPGRWLLAGALVAWYVSLIGAPPAALRAGLVFWGHALGRWRGRPARLSDLAGLAALVAVSLEPLTAAEPGFQLSFLGFAGVVAGHRLGSRLGARLSPGPGTGSGHRAVRWMAPLAAGTGAFLATAPATALHFGRVVATSIPASLIGTGLVGLALPAVFATAVLPGPIAVLAAPAAAALLAALCALAELFAELPLRWRWTGGTDWAALALLVLTVSALRARRSVRWRHTLAAGAVIAWWWGAPALAGLAGRDRHLLCTLDVGQGDAAVLRTAAGRWIVLDAGPGTSVLRGARLPSGPPRSGGRGDAGWRILAPFLESRGARRVELLLLSHPHLDHFGGSGALFDEFRVARVLDPGFPEPSLAYRMFLTEADREGATWVRAARGMRIVLDGVVIRVLWPPGPSREERGAATGPPLEDANAASLVFHVEAGALRYLNTGDAPAWVEDSILAREAAASRPRPPALRADVLKLGHHGSRTSTGLAWLLAVRPDIAVISSGRGNRYGHPHPAVLSRLDSAGVRRVWRTDIDGTLCIVAGPRSWRIIEP